MQARDIMGTPVITVTAATTVKAAATLLASNGYTTLPVLDADERLIGVVTEADIVRDRFPRDPRYYCTDEAGLLGGQILGAEDAPRVPAATVGEVMTSPAISVGARTDVVDLVTAMRDGGVRAMPIVEGSRVVGVVTRRDLLRTLGRDDRKIATDVRHRLDIYGGPDRWTVEVCDGAVSIHDTFDNAADRHAATVLAEAVRGVVVAHVTGDGVPR